MPLIDHALLQLYSCQLSLRCIRTPVLIIYHVETYLTQIISMLYCCIVVPEGTASEFCCNTLIDVFPYAYCSFSVYDIRSRAETQDLCIHTSAAKVERPVEHE
jgi:hypothetical protein